MAKVCEYPKCHREAHYLNSWDNENGKHFGMVCATHDRELGRINLVNIGMSVQECIVFEHYLKETVELLEYPDWPEWLEQYYKTHKPPRQFTEHSNSSSDTLTPREKDVTDLVCQGYTNHEIAEELGLTYNTVKRFMQNILQKLGARNRVEAILKLRNEQQKQNRIQQTSD